jgi:hypothetical protein
MKNVAMRDFSIRFVQKIRLEWLTKSALDLIYSKLQERRINTENVLKATISRRAFATCAPAFRVAYVLDYLQLPF